MGDKLEIGIYEIVLAEQGLADSIQSVTRPLPKVPRTGTDSLSLLSRREREVFERLARGETQRAVAEELGLSVKTVETYRARIRDKLGLHSRADLVAFALEAGILRPGST
ncbi:MAG: response regulator transcription factor [Sandaracinaceae bacterium]|nr:response regulator transcription factor [Sandaracinaceae bacterium]